MEIAHEAEMDLVEVASGAVPPVCRVMDYGKFLYERTKKEREARKSQTKIEIKRDQAAPKNKRTPPGFQNPRCSPLARRRHEGKGYHPFPRSRNNIS